MSVAQMLELADCMKRIVKEQAALAKHNAVSSDFDNTQTRRHRAHETARECAIEIRRLTHEAHCLAVEIGIADKRDASRYGPSTAPAGFGREIIFDRREPVEQGSAS